MRRTGRAEMDSTLSLVVVIRMYNSPMATPTETLVPPTAQAARRHFDRFAGLYGRSRLLDRLQRKALAVLQPDGDDRVLDVACGAGGLIANLAPRVERVVGVDLSDGMLDIARSRLAGLDNVELRLGRSDALPFDDGSFTALICTTAFHHFPDPQRSIDEMARVLAPGGRLVIGDLCRDSPPAKALDPLFKRFEEGHVGLQRKRDFEAMLARAGMHVTSSRYAWGLIYALVGAQRPT